ncbi:MAG TPA: phosphate ABC transporter, permease protein PstA, partial [bacterium]
MSKFWKSGDPFVWLTGGALATSLLMILGLVLLILANGLGQFWPGKLAELSLKDDQKLLGEIWEREVIPQPGEDKGEEAHRIRMKIGNRDLYSLDFRWVDESEVI